MLSTIIGAVSFVGEKERKTLEALIYTPARDSELFLGKVLAGVVPSVALAWVCLPGRSVGCCPSVWEYPGHSVQRSGWQMRV
ncbi:MAG: ABC transporter permease subunit [Chloroflexi bacterium]|nr:ABC transporter permease subunit [Chloroflexota bacterium]